MSSEDAIRRSAWKLRRGYFHRIHNKAAEEKERAAAEWLSIDINNNLSGAVAKLWSP